MAPALGDPADGASILTGPVETFVDGPLPEGAVIEEFAAPHSGLGHPGYTMDACPTCGGFGSGCPTCAPAAPGLHYPDLYWVSAESLFWWTKGMRTPPLVTTGTIGTLEGDAGVLGFPGTRVLYGGDDLFSDDRLGARFQAGFWLDRCHRLGVEGDYWYLGDESANYRAQSAGNPILSRPFINAANNTQDAELVAFPNILRGAVAVDSFTEIHSAGVRAVLNLGCRAVPVGGVPPGRCGSNWDVMVGYRYSSLQEGLAITEDLVSLRPQPDDGEFDIVDDFRTSNHFHGIDLGIRWRYYRVRWTYEFLARVALGNTLQEVAINGQTIATAGGVSNTGVGGLLAQATNIGRQTRNEFSTIPEFGFRGYFQVTDRLQFSLGYSVIYWNDVVRPGDQIDFLVNPNLLPPPTLPLPGPARPAFTFADSSFWAQGITLGMNFQW